MRSSGCSTAIDRIRAAGSAVACEMKHDYGMSARQRFVLGARLLLVAACLLIAGRVVWSRVDTRHVHRITVPGVCLNAPVEDGAYAGLSTQLEPAGRFPARSCSTRLRRAMHTT